MTYSELMSAVTDRLETLFGGEYPVWTGTGVQTAAGSPQTEAGQTGFCVQLLEASETPGLGQRYFRATSLCIRFLPGSAGQEASKQAEMLETLMNGMEYVETAGGSLRGTGRNAAIKDGILNFYVNYNMFVAKPLAKEETMGEFSVKEEVISG